MDEEWQVRGVAALAIGQFAGVATSDATSALTEVLRDDNAAVRKAAAIALGEIGARARSAITTLEVAARDDNLAVRESAADAIRKISIEQN